MEGAQQGKQAKRSTKEAEDVKLPTEGAQQGKQAERSTKEAEDVKLPTETSPYVKHDNIEEYKSQAYGVQGHKTPVDRPHHGGGTDAPTLSGSGLTQTQTNAVDAINRQGVP